MFSLMVVYIYDHFVIFFPLIINSSSIFLYKNDSEPEGSLDQILTGCAARERQNPLISKEDERTK